MQVHLDLYTKHNRETDTCIVYNLKILRQAEYGIVLCISSVPFSSSALQSYMLPCFLWSWPGPLLCFLSSVIMVMTLVVMVMVLLLCFRGDDTGRHSDGLIPMLPW